MEKTMEYEMETRIMEGIMGVGFRKIRDTFWRGPRLRIIVIWDLYWVPLLMETTTLAYIFPGVKSACRISIV